MANETLDLSSTALMTKLRVLGTDLTLFDTVTGRLNVPVLFELLVKDSVLAAMLYTTSTIALVSASIVA